MTEITASPTPPEPWLSKKAIGAHYNLSTRTIERWIHRGCESRVIGGVRRLRISEVEAFLASEEG
jgi:hypothetical protein